jgi:hypothetical protein
MTNLTYYFKPVLKKLHIKIIYLLHVVQTGSEARTATYQMGSRASFSKGKAVGA